MRRQEPGIDRGIGREVKLRRATPADSEFAFQTKKAALGRYIEQVWGWDEAEQRRFHEDRYARREYHVIQTSGADVGILVAERLPSHIAVYQLFVLPEHQGKGLGTECMKRILADAAALKLPVRLDVLKVNRQALRFYRGLGFRSVDETETHIKMEGIGGEKAPIRRDRPT
ncbi:MAG: GNAT family N-acetyltransferase [candidate division WOR-3 bacterium]|nr:MAG: GNAT family N-acetyltransferase [candidate division WOR-3 bacterium]